MGWAGRKLKRIDKGIYFIWSRKYIFFICDDLSVYWLKHRYTQAVNCFHPLLFIILTLPFDQENISSSSAMTFPCIGWNTDKKEDAAQYRFWMLDFADRSVFGGEWSLSGERAATNSRRLSTVDRRGMEVGLPRPEWRTWPRRASQPGYKGSRIKESPNHETKKAKE